MKKIRKARGLTQDDLAEMIGMDPSTVQRAEVMHSSAKISTYIAIAKVLDVTLGDLFAANRPATETAIVAILRRLKPADQQHALALLELVESRQQ